MHDLNSRPVIIWMHHQAPGEYADAPFERAHIYVHLKAGYILALKESAGKGDNRHVCAAQKFLHIKDVGQIGRFVEPWVGSC